jgi:hypothetical protein
VNRESAVGNPESANVKRETANAFCAASCFFFNPLRPPPPPPIVGSKATSCYSLTLSPLSTLSTFHPLLTVFNPILIQQVTSTGTNNRYPCNRNPVTGTLHPAPCTLKPAPCNLHPATCTLHPVLRIQQDGMKPVSPNFTSINACRS